MATTAHEGQAEVRRGSVGEQGPAGEAPELVAQRDLKWGPAPDAFPAGCELCLLHGDPAAEGTMFSVRLRASRQYVYAPHRHPHDEHVTVISGSLHLGNGATLDRGGATLLQPGDYAFLPREQYHYAWTGPEEVVIQVEAIGPFGITYANPEDDPRNTPAAH